MGITRSRDFSVKECKRDWHLLPPETLVCLRKGQHLSLALVWVCVVWGTTPPPTKYLNACLYLLLPAAALFAPHGLPRDATGLWGEGWWGSKGSECKCYASPALFFSSVLSRIFNAELLSMEMHFTIKSILKKKAKSQVTQGIAFGWLMGKAVGWKLQTSPCAFSFAKIQLLSCFSHHKIVSLSFPGGCITGAGM